MGSGGLHALPHGRLFEEPTQELLACKLDDVEERIADGKGVLRLNGGLQCYCKIYSQCLLRYQHIFHLDSKDRVLTPTQLNTYFMVFGECSMEVYETMGTVWVEDGGSGRNAKRTNMTQRFEQV